jgi:hypothetical protein
LIAIIFAGASIVAMALANKNLLTLDSKLMLLLIIAASICAVAFLLFKIRKRLLFLMQWRNKEFSVTDPKLKALLGFKSFTTYDGMIVVDTLNNNRKVGIAFILITKLPFMIQELDADQQLYITSSFSRLLGTFNHPFTYMPICKPVDRKRFTDKISDRVRHIDLIKLVSKAPIDQRLLIEQKVLQKQLERLSQGESPMEVVYLIQLKESGNKVEEIRQNLEVNVQSMIRNLEVIHQVRARRLIGTEIIDAFHEFFLLEG